MAEKCSFFNSISGDRKYSAEDWASYFSSFISDGVYAKPQNTLQVLADSGMNITVSVGKGFIKGYYYNNTTVLPLEIALADALLNRIDRVVLRWSLAERRIYIAVKQGELASNAVAPALTRTAETWELALADISIPKGSTAITQTNITDRRMYGDLCGYVTGVVDQLDFSELCAQFESFFSEYEVRIANRYTQAENEMVDWIDNIKYVLDGDVAVHLQSEIETKQDTITATGLLKGTGATQPQSAEKGVDYGAKTFNIEIPLNNAAWLEETDGYYRDISGIADVIASGYAYVVTPNISCFGAFADAMVRADEVTANGTMRFHCTDKPEKALTVNVLRVVSV